MKTLKFDHDSSELILSGKKNSTWRLFDDKDLSVDDTVKLVDKVKPDDPKTWKVIGQGRIREVIEKRLGDVTEQDMAGHEHYDSKDGMLKHYKSFYGDRITLDTVVKMIYFDFSPNISGDLPTAGMLLDEAKLYTDGGSRGNPGKSACAFVICKVDGTVVEKSGQFIGMATNNQAEYTGFLRGLERCRDLGINHIILMSDSELVVNQMNGKYKVKNQELAPLYQQVKELAASFESIQFVYVPREMNKTADTEVNRILDQNVA